MILGEADEILEFSESRNLMGRGLGYVDLHLLASAILRGVDLWTADKRLRAVAGELCSLYELHYSNHIYIDSPDRTMHLTFSVAFLF